MCQIVLSPLLPSRLIWLWDSYWPASYSSRIPINAIVKIDHITIITIQRVRRCCNVFPSLIIRLY